MIRKQNDPEEKIKKLLEPEDHEVDYANQLESINLLLNPQNIETAVIFKNQNPTKMRLSKYWISNDNKL